MRPSLWWRGQVASFLAQARQARWPRTEDEAVSFAAIAVAVILITALAGVIWVLSPSSAEAGAILAAIALFAYQVVPAFTHARRQRDDVIEREALSLIECAQRVMSIRVLSAMDRNREEISRACEEYSSDFVSALDRITATEKHLRDTLDDRSRSLEWQDQLDDGVVQLRLRVNQHEARYRSDIKALITVWTIGAVVVGLATWLALSRLA